MCRQVDVQYMSLSKSRLPLSFPGKLQESILFWSTCESISMGETISHRRRFEHMTTQPALSVTATLLPRFPWSKALRSLFKICVLETAGKSFSCHHFYVSLFNSVIPICYQYHIVLDTPQTFPPIFVLNYYSGAECSRNPYLGWSGNNMFLLLQEYPVIIIFNDLGSSWPWRLWCILLLMISEYTIYSIILIFCLMTVEYFVPSYMAYVSSVCC